MKVRLKIENKEYKIPIPISLGTLALRLIPSKSLSKQNKKVAVNILKEFKKECRNYKGLNIVEIKSANGEEITITI